MSEATKPRGWAKPANAQKYHYFPGDGRSLCGSWLFFPTYAEDEYDDHAENCAECKRRVAKLRAEEVTNG